MTWMDKGAIVERIKEGQKQGHDASCKLYNLECDPVRSTSTNGYVQENVGVLDLGHGFHTPPLVGRSPVAVGIWHEDTFISIAKYQSINP
jgi:hypothetical protein